MNETTMNRDAEQGSPPPFDNDEDGALEQLLAKVDRP
jgi:hypothetical protein